MEKSRIPQGEYSLDRRLESKYESHLVKADDFLSEMPDGTRIVLHLGNIPPRKSLAAIIDRLQLNECDPPELGDLDADEEDDWAPDALDEM